MTISLRAHHLLCMLTYAGKGYSAAFTANYDMIAGRLSRGEDILLVSGPDDICAPLLKRDDPHCLRESVIERDNHAAQAVAALLSHPISPGARITLSAEILMRMREAFARGQTRKACKDCEWASLCTTIAADGFQHSRLTTLP